MTPHDILQYSYFNALLNHHQKCCIIQQMRTNTKTHVIQKVRDLGILGPKQEVSIKFLPPWFREPHIALLYYNYLLCVMRNML